MDQPVLVVDFGTSTSSAAVVGHGQDVTAVRLVREPATGSWSWPSSVCLDGEEILVGTLAENLKHDDPTVYRTEFKPDIGEPDPIRLGDKSFRPADLVTELLVVLREQAAALLGGTAPERVLLTVPATYRETDPAWPAMITAAEQAGFAEVELLPEPVAAAFAPVAGGPLAAGSTVLVYDFGGGTFDAALVRMGAAGEHEVLAGGAVAACGGRDVDALVRRHIEEQAAPVIAELTGDEVSSWHVRLELTDFARVIKHQLSTTTRARGRFLARQLVSIDRAEFDRLVQPLIERTIRCCLDVLASAGATLSDVDAVLVVGGSSRMPVVTRALTAQLGRPLRLAEDPTTAVVHGAAEWVTGAARRAGAARGPAEGETPLRWDFPTGFGVLVRWLVEPGERVRAGAPLGVVRIADGRLWRLLAGEHGGALARVHAAAGDPVTSDDWLATLTSGAGTGDRPALDRVAVGGSRMAVDVLAYAPDGDRLALGRGNTVDVHDFAAGAGRTALTCQYPVRRLGFDEHGHVWACGAGAVDVEVVAEDTMPRTLAQEGTTAVDISQDRQSVAVAVSGGLVQVWNIARKRVLLTKPHVREIGALAFSHDGQRLASGCETAVFVWNVVTGDLHLRLPQISASDVLTFSPGGRLLCAADSDGGVAVVSMVRGTVSTRLTHGAPVRGIAVNRQETTVVTVGEDGVARLWHTATGEQGTPIELDTPVRAVAFSPSGRQLACGLGDGSVAITELGAELT